MTASPHGAGGRRVIPWDAIDDARALDASRRAIVAASWSARARQEHLAVGAFALLTYEVAEHGGAGEVLEILARAPSDEHRHARICARFAGMFRDEHEPEAPSTWKGVPNVPKHRTTNGRDRTLLHVVEMCCLHETFTGIGLTELRERTTSPVARAMIESLLEDEIDHGRVGWAHAATACADGWGRRVIADALPGILSRVLGPIVAAEGHGPRRDAQLDAHGYVDGEDAARVYRTGLRDVVLPGFEHLGIDVSRAKAHAMAEGFLSAS
jgi:hypothetical protein